LTDTGKLYLIPNIISQNNAAEQISPITIQTIRQLDYFIVEHPRAARRLLKICGVSTPFDHIRFAEWHEHSSMESLEEICKPVLRGRDAGLISEAGMPSIADPGESLIMYAHTMRIRVIPLTGPSAIFQALAASGLNAEQFVFHGYLPVKEKDRIEKIRDMEKHAIISTYTQIFIETPYRNDALLKSILQSCRKESYLSIAVDISDIDEHIQTRKITDWQKEIPSLNKKPAVFILGTYPVSV
jgi:16S rRNA (cytidine1402-2'-O)-methyltransferase